MSGLIASNGALLSANGLLLAATGGGSGGGSGGGTAPTGGASGIAAVNLIGNGQSNAAYAYDTDNALNIMAQGVAFYLGAAASGAFHASGNGGAAVTEVSSIGLLELTATYTGYAGAFLDNTAASSALTAAEAAAAPLGSCGTGYSAFCAALTSAQRAAMSACAIYWGESDSTEYTAATKAVYKAACANWMAQIRGFLGKSAAAFPVWWFGPPFAYGANQVGQAIVRESWRELAADPTQNALWLVPQTYDVIYRDAVYDAANGTYSGGSNVLHVSALDNVALCQRAALAGARSLLSANGLAQSMIPSTLGAGEGPSVASAVLSGDQVTVTIAHDAGTDLIVPLQAANGVGWAVMDGGTYPSALGTIIAATSCTRVNATTLLITLASAPVNAGTSCRLFYPWGSEFGRGDAVTDNFSTISAAAGAFNIAGSLGSGWGANFPVQPPMTLTGSGASTVAAYGIEMT